MGEGDAGTVVAVDSGGTTTRLLVDGLPDRAGEVLTFPSTNPATVGDDAAARTRAEVVRAAVERVDGCPVRGWWACCTVSATTGPDDGAARIADALRAGGLRGAVLISDDVTPLLFAPPAGGRGAVAVVGTGSAFRAGDGTGVVRAAGGYEYVASDEGSAHALGRAGLARAARAFDGRAGATALLDELVAAAGGRDRVPTYLRALARRPKSGPAGFAHAVTRCWAAGDRAATGIVEAAAVELAEGVAAVRSACGLDGDPTMLSGGVVQGCPPYAALATDAVLARCGRHPVRVCTSPVHDIASAAGQYAAPALRIAITRGLVHEAVLAG